MQPLVFDNLVTKRAFPANNQQLQLCPQDFNAPFTMIYYELLEVHLHPTALLIKVCIAKEFGQRKSFNSIFEKVVNFDHQQDFESLRLLLLYHNIFASFNYLRGGCGCHNVFLKVIHCIACFVIYDLYIHIFLQIHL